MSTNIPLAVRNLIDEYRSFLRTSFRFLDDHLRQGQEDHNPSNIEKSVLISYEQQASE